MLQEIHLGHETPRRAYRVLLCEKEKDYETRGILEKLLDGTETDHIYWLEQQQSLIDKVGLKNCLQLQM
jgi:bacterioferritin